MKPRHTAKPKPAEPADSARAVGLRYVTDEEPGIQRIKAGAGFRYQSAGGKPVRKDSTLRRIRSLVIPPAWTDVWICMREDGHLQATGRDAKGRKQFRYHPLWRQVRDATKYDRMIEFGQALPHIRRRVAHDIAKRNLNREKVLAAVVRLMDLTLIRIGNEEYARKNNSYGLTTMKDQHATVRGERVHFSFRGKSGKYHTISVADRRLARIVKRCQDIPGQELFQWITMDGKRRDVTSGDVNDYLREVSGSDFTAKDFRTWAGTVLAAQALRTCGFQTQKQAKVNLKRAIAGVAEKLGNTPAICRKCYVHPFVLDGYLQKKLPCNGKVAPALESGRAVRSGRPAGSLGSEEKAVLQFLRCCGREKQRTFERNAERIGRLPSAWRPRDF